MACLDLEELPQGRVAPPAQLLDVDVRELGVVEQAPKLLGRNILMVVMPNPKTRQAAKTTPPA